MGFKPMYKLMTALSVLVLISFSGSASAATCPAPGVIEQLDQQIITYDVGQSYCANIEVGGSAIWTTGLEFTDPNARFDLTVLAGQDLIGNLHWNISSGPGGTGNTFNFGSLVANEIVTLSLFGSNSSPSNPTEGWISFAAPDMPELSSIESTSVVPVPAAVWLFGSGLLGLVGLARRKA